MMMIIDDYVAENGSPCFRRASGGDADDVTLEATPTDDVSVAVLPLYHGFGLCVHIIHGLTVGQQIVVMAKFDPNKYLQLIAKYKVSSPSFASH